MSTQTAYFNLVTRLITVSDPSTEKTLSGFPGMLKNVSDQSYLAGKALQTALGFATYQVVAGTLMGIKDFISGSIDAFVDFEYAMAGVARTVEDFAENEVVLNKFALTMSQSLGVAATDVAEAMQYMGSVGYNSSEIMRDFNDIAKMGVALQIDLEDAIQTVVKAQQVWNDEGYTATQVSDILNQMTNKTALNMEFLAGALRMGGPAAAATNTTLEEMTAILVELAETGFQGTMAGRSLNTILIQLGLKSEELTSHLKELKTQGFDVNLEAMEGFKDATPIEQIQKLARATDGLTDSQKIQIAQMIGGTNFLKQMLILLDNAEDLTENLDVATDSLNSTQDEFNVVMDTSEMKLRQQEERIKALQVSIGEGLTPAWLGLKEAIATTLDSMVNGNDQIDKNSRVVTLNKTAIDSETKALEELLFQFQTNQITEEDYYAKIQEATAWRYEQTEAEKDYEVQLQSSRTAVGDYTDALWRQGQISQEVTDALNKLKLEQTELIILEKDMQNALYEVQAALGYAESGVQDLAQTTATGTWYVQEAKDAYNVLGDELYATETAVRALEDQMKELNDEMYANSLQSAELRYEQLLLEQQLKEGTITEKEYKNQMSDLEDQMFYNRVEAARLNIENMKVSESLKDNKEKAAQTKDQMKVLMDANNRLTSSAETYASMTQGVIDKLDELITQLGLTLTGSNKLEDGMSEDFDNLEENIDDSVNDAKRHLQSLQDKLRATMMTYDDYERKKQQTYTPPPKPPTGTGSGGYEGGDVSLASGFEGWVNQPTRFVVGEAGPEYLSVTPANRSRPVGGTPLRGNPSIKEGNGGMGGNNNINIYLPSVTSVEDPQQVKQIFRRVMLELSGER